MSKKSDANQPAIVAELRELGAAVMDLHELGKGRPDILVGWKGMNLLVEIKSSKKAKLTPDEVKFFESWPQGTAIVATTTEEIVEWFRLTLAMRVHCGKV